MPENGRLRFAAECAEDLAADGIVYAEVRYAPELFLEGSMSLAEVVEAVQVGFRLGEARAAAAGRPIRVGTLLTAMRHAARSREVAELVVAYRDQAVVGFDIAGAEAMLYDREAEYPSGAVRRTTMCWPGTCGRPAGSASRKVDIRSVSRRTSTTRASCHSCRAPPGGT